MRRISTMVALIMVGFCCAIGVMGLGYAGMQLMGVSVDGPGFAMLYLMALMCGGGCVVWMAVELPNTVGERHE